jgi:hypothetical protein
MNCTIVCIIIEMYGNHPAYHQQQMMFRGDDDVPLYENCPDELLMQNNQFR